MLYFIGLGLGDASDITVKGLQIVQKCHKVYLEAYTSILTIGHEALETFYKRSIILADREKVEVNSDDILEEARTHDIAFLVVGDPFGATTHTDLDLRAKKKGVVTKCIHNASILSAISTTGLNLINFGETVSIPFWTETWKPESFIDKILRNKSRGLHTLCLLDIKVKEQTIENLMRGRKVYEPPHFMTTKVAASQLIQGFENKKDSFSSSADFKSFQVILLSRIGSESQVIKTCNLSDAVSMDIGPPLHSLILIGKVDDLEKRFLYAFKSS